MGFWLLVLNPWTSSSTSATLSLSTITSSKMASIFILLLFPFLQLIKTSAPNVALLYTLHCARYRTLCLWQYLWFVSSSWQFLFDMLTLNSKLICSRQCLFLCVLHCDYLRPLFLEKSIMVDGINMPLIDDCIIFSYFCLLSFCLSVFLSFCLSVYLSVLFDICSSLFIGIHL